MKSHLAVVALTGVALLYGGDTYAQSRSYLRTPPSPELYNVYLLTAPSPDMVTSITISSVIAASSVTVSGVDQNGNVTVTLPDGTQVSVPASMMDDRSIGDLLDVANQAIALGGYNGGNNPYGDGDISVNDSDISGDYSGSGDQNSNGAEYE